MKNKRRIGIDLDDVLADFHTPIMNYHNKMYGTSLKPEDFKTYSFNEVWGGTLEEAIRKVNDFQRSVYFSEISPILDSVTSIEALSKENELFVVTSRPLFTRERTEMWLNKFFKDKFEGISYSSNHYSRAENSGKTKSDICRDLGVSVLIDDSLDYLMQCLPLGITEILFGDYPWNQNGNLPSGIFRIKGWKEILKKLK